MSDIANSVLGIISIPGTMTGAMLGGSSVEQAARLQMIVAFMLAASSSLATIIAVTCTLIVCIDEEHRVRADRIYERPTALWRVLAMTGCTLRCAASACVCKSHSVFASEEPLSNNSHTEKVRPALRPPVTAESSGCRGKMSAAVHSSMCRIRRGRCQPGHAVSEFLSADSQRKTDMLNQGLSVGLRGPSLFTISMLFISPSSQSKRH